MPSVKGQNFGIIDQFLNPEYRNDLINSAINCLDQEDKVEPVAVTIFGFIDEKERRYKHGPVVHVRLPVKIVAYITHQLSFNAFSCRSVVFEGKCFVFGVQESFPQVDGEDYFLPKFDFVMVVIFFIFDNFKNVLLSGLLFFHFCDCFLKLF